MNKILLLNLALLFSCNLFAQNQKATSKSKSYKDPIAQPKSAKTEALQAARPVEDASIIMGNPSDMSAESKARKLKLPCTIYVLIDEADVNAKSDVLAKVAYFNGATNLSDFEKENLLLVRFINFYQAEAFKKAYPDILAFTSTEVELLQKVFNFSNDAASPALLEKLNYKQ